ncbi:hypothetical protein ACFYNL_26505 [Streptomyces sp. NPDC007808]|uniref:hypothetical protein n=1 Tax=Streptomyces sp. NPDC007808 TaxID=3364779 RepID=UPI00368B2EE5
MRRVLGWACGAVLAFAMAFWCVTATADLALSAGLYGTPGTYQVERCYDTNPRGRYTEYDCRGRFVPTGGTTADAFREVLEDTGHDYPDGTELAVRQGMEPETIQRVGFWGVMGEFWQIAIGVAVLAVLAYQAVRPRGADARREAHRRAPSRRQKAADRFGVAVVVALPVGLLSWAVAFLAPAP